MYKRSSRESKSWILPYLQGYLTFRAFSCNFFRKISQSCPLILFSDICLCASLLVTLNGPKSNLNGWFSNPRETKTVKTQNRLAVQIPSYTSRSTSAFVLSSSTVFLVKTNDFQEIFRRLTKCHGSFLIRLALTLKMGALSVYFTCSKP